MKTLIYTLLLSVIAAHTATAQNVGVGTTSPGMALHVSKATDTALLLLENRTTLAAGTSTGLYFKNGLYTTSAIKTIGTGGAVARLSFFTYAGAQSDLKERMSITDDGNVGIGTTAPTADLHVKGSVRLEATGAGAGKVLTSDANGNATWQAPASNSPVGFYAVLASDMALVSGASTDLVSYTEKFDDGGVFNSATGRFTAPSDGVYQFSYNLNFTETGSDTKYLNVFVKRGNGNVLAYNFISPGINSNASSNFVNTFMLKMVAGEYISLNIERSAVSGNTLRGGSFANSTYFQGHKLY